MPFILKDETAGVNIIYIDDSGQVGIMGSANAGQMLSFAGLGLIQTSGYLTDGIAGPGSASALTGTIVIPVSSTGSVGYSTVQVPSVTSDPQPSSVTTTTTQWTNQSSGSSMTVNYNIW